MIDYSLIFSEALKVIIDPNAIFFVTIGTLLGLIFGALPGLTATMGVALLIPITYSMAPAYALASMLGCFIGGIAGGAVSAILLHIPGTPASVSTTFDGYPLAKQGRGAEALGWAAFASGWGSIVSWAVLVFLAPMLASVCVSFSSPEYAALAFFGLTIISAISGKSIAKGLVSGLLGIFISCVGMDPVYGTLRFTFNNLNLLSGIDTLPAIGFYSIPKSFAAVPERVILAPWNYHENFVPSIKNKWHTWLILYAPASLNHCWNNSGYGSGIAAYIAYDQAKRFSKDRFIWHG